MNPLIERLEEALPPEDVYPAGVVKRIRPIITGRSFFPGGCGLAGGSTAKVSIRPVMLVGQDFGNIDYWDTWEAAQRVGDRATLDTGEPTSGTWHGLQGWDNEGVIRLSECFLTNALLGVRHDDDIEGPSCGLTCERYVQESLRHLRLQIKTLQPRAVVALGKVPAILLAIEFGCVGWVRPRGPSGYETRHWKDIDTARLQFVESVEVDGAPPFAFSTSIHPCRPSNARVRTWNEAGLSGAQAQHEILRRAFAAR